MKNYFQKYLKIVALSPYFFLRGLCGVSLIHDGIQDGHNESGQLEIRTLLAARFALPSAVQAKKNYEGYCFISHILGKYGYRKKMMKHFMDSNCGRAQAKMASKELGYLPLFQQHKADLGVKFYHLDRKISLSILYPTEAALVAAATLYSHHALNNKIQNSDDEVTCLTHQSPTV